MGKFGGLESRNHGYGRDMGYAGSNVIAERFGDGHFQTKNDLESRWNAFTDYCKSQEGIRDMRDVTANTVQNYAQSVMDSGYAASTAQNYISAVNTVMDQARDGGWATVSPSAATGTTRDNVRTEAPASLDRERVQAAVRDLQASGQDRAAAVVALARETGMRAEEAAKADLGRLEREAEKREVVNIQEGTKGGRGSPVQAPREIAATSAVREAIAQAQAASPEGSRNLIGPGETYAQLRDGELDRGRDALRQEGIGGYHDARAAYACERYQQITGHQAPVVAGGRETPKEGPYGDRAARSVISQELGHSHDRTDVTASYLGSAA